MISPSMIDYLLQLVALDIKQCDQGILKSQHPEQWEGRKDLAMKTHNELQQLKQAHRSVPR